MRRGFTLIELIAVIVVLAVLAGVAVPKYLDYSSKAYLTLAKDFHGKLVAARTMYLGAMQRLPTNFYGWVALAEGGSDMNFIRVEQNVRSALIVPNDDLASNGYRTLTLNFKNGLVATYTIDANGTINFTTTGP